MKGKKLRSRILRLAGERWPGRAAVEENLKLLCAGGGTKEKLEEYYGEKLSLLLKILGAGLLLTLLSLLLAGENEILTEGYLLPRKKAAYIQELDLIAGEDRKERVDVEVEPRKLTREESRKLLEETVSRMESMMLGENASPEEIRSDLNLMREVEDTPITVEWELDSYEVLNLDGSLRQDKLKEEGTLVSLTARLFCEGEEAVYRAAVKVFPPLLSEQEKWEKSVRDAIAQSQEKSSQEEMKTLPDEIGGMKVSWKERGSSPAAGALILTLVCAAAVYIGRDSELKKKAEERERQMQRDYARIVTKLVLLMGAGATARSAWELIVRDYLRKKENGQEKYRYAYEEMALVCREIQNGVAEAKAYENFGLRCRIPCYLKLSALLEQNLKKGGKGLSQLLQAEMGEAFEQRKACAVRRGEEAATRLLFPMVMMLAVVMLLILIPAGMSMQL